MLPLLISAAQAAALTGYPNAACFYRAVKRGVMPPPRDPGARPQG